MCRIVGGQMLLGKMEKEVFRKQMWVMAEFCGLEVLTYCVMGNHFHILLRVPSVEDREESDVVLLSRVEGLYGRDSVYYGFVESVFNEKDSVRARELREQLLARMYDMSVFMKELKQRFSIWYNKSHGRYGTLWADRFKSVLVENKRFSLETVAAYIDLNPLRAGLVDDPKDYRYSGYGEAMGGSTLARKGIEGCVCEAGWSKTVECYRQLLFGKGGVVQKEGQNMIDAERVRSVLENGGKVSRAEALRCRMRYFSDGLIIGGENFIAGVLNANEGTLGQKAKLKGKVLGDNDWGGLMSYRDLKKNVFS
tara:strand:- start:495 stop:1421 length:927 start_codon:yes stop_codon:yes gene_type:complete